LLLKLKNGQFGRKFKLRLKPFWLSVLFTNLAKTREKKIFSRKKLAEVTPGLETKHFEHFWKLLKNTNFHPNITKETFQRGGASAEIGKTVIPTFQPHFAIVIRLPGSVALNIKQKIEIFR